MNSERLVDQLSEMSTRQLVRWLSTPAQSGFLLTAADLERIGEGIGLRVAPYGRSAGIEQLLRGAALDDRLDEVLALIGTEMAEQLEEYRALDVPEMGPWVERAAATVDAWNAVSAAFHLDDSGTQSG